MSAARLIFKAMQLRVVFISIFLLIFSVSTLFAVSQCSWVTRAECAKDANKYGSYCDISSCYCGSPYVSTPTLSISRCAQPGWLPSVGGAYCYPHGLIDNISEYKCDCSIKISIVSPVPVTYGGSITISGSIASTDPLLTWTASINGSNISSAGTQITIPWDGKDSNGKQLPPGTYPVSITAKSSDGKCSDTVATTVTILPTSQPSPVSGGPSMDQCVASTVNIGNGCYNHEQLLFSLPGAPMLGEVALYYSGSDSYKGSLGQGWSHSFDIYFKKNSDNSILIRHGSGRYRYFTPQGSGYIPSTGDTGSIFPDSIGYTLVEQDGTRLSFNQSGLLQSITDRAGRSITFTYTGNNLSKVTDPTGRKITFTSDTSGRIISIADPAGNTHKITYANGLISSVTRPDNKGWQYNYDSKGFITSKTDPAGNIFTNSYDASGRLVTSTDPLGRSKQITWDSIFEGDNSTTITEKDGNPWQYRYDPVKSLLIAKIAPSGATWRYSYDSNGRVATIEQPDGTLERYTWDSNGNKLTYTNGNGATTGYSYNSFGQPVRIIDPMDQTTTLDYDTKGNITTVTAPNGTTKYTWDANSNPSAITDPMGNTTNLQYDAGGSLLSLTDPRGGGTKITRNANGSITSITLANGGVIKQTWDTLNRLTSVTDPNGGVTKRSYDSNSNITAITDQTGSRIITAYDQLNRPVKTVNGAGAATQYSWTATDDLYSITDPAGNSTTYSRNPLGLPELETDPLGNGTRYGYNSAGTITSRTDANGVTVTYSHDGAGRITSKTAPEGETRYSYDANGRITSASNNHISYNFNHDAAGRIISVNDSLGNSLSYSHDANGNRTGVTLPDARQISYSYDASNNPVKITFPAGEFSIGYNAVNQRASLTYPNGITTAYTFDKAGNLTKLHHKGVTTLAYSYDKAGNRTKLTQDNATTSYSYDKSYQLTNAGTDSYKYDAAGNRISGPNAKTVYTTGTGNQTLSTDKQAKNATYPKAEFKYDRNGNLTEKKEYDNSGNIRQTSLFGYDSDNMMITAEITRDGKKKQISYLYDPFGRRIEKNIKTDELNAEGDTEEEGTPRITRYLYDGPNIIQQTNGKGKVTATYIHGPGIDEPLAIETRGKEWYYYHADALGSILALTDDHGKTVQSYSYDAFGNTKKSGNKVKQPFGFTGRELDTETGLYSYRLRTYDQDTGKFIQKDPIGFAAGDTNLYRYVGNNSTNYTDPWGMEQFRSVMSNIVNSEAFISFGELIGASHLNAALTGYDFRGNEFVGLDRVGQFIVFLGSRPSPVSGEKQCASNSKINPNQKIIDQLQGKGQLRDLRNNPNLSGVNIEELLQKTPNQLNQMIKNGEINERTLKQIKKAFEGRSLGQ